jgi:hypothetical protein
MRQEYRAYATDHERKHVSSQRDSQADTRSTRLRDEYSCRHRRFVIRSLERIVQRNKKGRGIRGLLDASMMQRVSAIPLW